MCKIKIHEYAEPLSWRRCSSHPACRRQRTRKQEQRVEQQRLTTVSENWFTDLTNVQHGQHDGRDVGEFTCQTQRQHLTNAASPELHTHDTCAGNTDPLNLPQHSAANTASVWFNSLSFIPSSLLVSRCSWGTKMWQLRRWVCSSTTDEVQLWSTCTLLSLLLCIYFLQQWWKKHPGPLL